MSDQENAALNRLLRGISTYDVATVREAWCELLNTPEIAIPRVCKNLRSPAWRKKPRGPSDRYLGVLLALLHELDSTAFKNEIQRLRAEPLHPLHKKTIEIMAKRRGDQVFGRINDQVPVYISRDIEQPDVVFSSLQSWSQTRDLAISKITRVDVITRFPEMDYLGKYDFFYDGIILTRRKNRSVGIVGWFQKMEAELTFYHEVGHHYFQHSEGGQVEKQEREADNYKRRMFRNAHPVLVPLGRVVFFPVLGPRKLLIYLKNRRSGLDV